MASSDRRGEQGAGRPVEPARSLAFRPPTR